MSKIIDVRKTAVKFLTETINSEDVTIIKIGKINDTWKAVAEVYENDSFLKSMNLPPKKIRLFYSVSLDDKLEVLSFERHNTFEEISGSDGS
jgi:Gas vesicle synthesis protein GvpO